MWSSIFGSGSLIESNQLLDIKAVYDHIKMHHTSCWLCWDEFDQNLQYSSLKCTLPTTTKFCTRHDSVTVVTCAKFRCDRLSIFETRALPILIEFRIRSKYRLWDGRLALTVHLRQFICEHVHLSSTNTVRFGSFIFSKFPSYKRISELCHDFKFNSKYTKQGIKQVEYKAYMT